MIFRQYERYGWQRKGMPRRARPSLLPDGRFVLALKQRYHDGTTHMIFEPVAFIERIAALVPRPHKNPVFWE